MISRHNIQKIFSSSKYGIKPLIMKIKYDDKSDNKRNFQWDTMYTPSFCLNLYMRNLEKV